MMDANNALLVRAAKISACSLPVGQYGQNGVGVVKASNNTCKEYYI